MNRVKKTSRMYEQSKPEIDYFRKIKAHLRRMRKLANRTAQARDNLQKHQAELEAMTVKDLRLIAKEANIQGRSKMSKDRLVQEILKI